MQSFSFTTPSVFPFGTSTNSTNAFAGFSGFGGFPCAVDSIQLINALKDFLSSLTIENSKSENELVKFVDMLKVIPSYHRANIQFNHEGKQLSITDFVLEQKYFKLLPVMILHGYCKQNFSNIMKHIKKFSKNNVITSEECFVIMEAIIKCKSSTYKAVETNLVEQIDSLTEKVAKTDYMFDKYFKVSFKNLIETEYSGKNKKRKTAK